MAAGISAGVEVGGRWHLGGQLGQGALGQVFRADDSSTLNLGAAAVKVLHPSTGPREREAFHEEIRKVASLRHPNLVAYLDSGEHHDDDGRPHLYLVTELCRYSLQAYLAREPGRLTAHQCERLLADMAAGLGYLHSRQLLHRDLKPANVLLGGDDGWKLGDFGLPGAMRATGRYHHGAAVMGTPRYMAPELFEDGAASAASDVYAAGVTLHQALTGRTVHEGTDVALLVQVTTTSPKIHRDLPPHWRRLIEQCLERDPADRPGASQLPAVLASSRIKPSSRLAQLSGTSPLARHLGRPLPPPPVAMLPAHPSTLALGPGRAPSPAAAPAAPPPGGPPVSLASMSVTGGRRPRVLLVAPLVAVALLVIGGVAAVLARRGGTEDTTNHSTVRSTDSIAPAALGGRANSTTAHPEAAAQAAARVAAIAAGPSDAPAGFATSDASDASDTGFDEMCSGVQQVPASHPPLAFRSNLFQNGGQLFVAWASVYPSAADAEAAFAAGLDVLSACDGQPTTDGAAEPVWRTTRLDDVALHGAAQTSSTLIEVVGDEPVTLSTVQAALGIYARVDDVVLYSAGTDRAVAVWYAELMLARANEEVPPPKVEPAGTVGTVAPGPASEVRLAAADPATGVGATVTEWLAGHGNGDLERLAEGGCRALGPLGATSAVPGALRQAWDDLAINVRAPLTAGDHAQLMAVAAPRYCPDEATRLGIGQA